MTPSFRPALVSLKCGMFADCMMACVICTAMRMISALSTRRPSTPMRSSMDIGVSVWMSFWVCSSVKVSSEVFL